MKIKLCFVSFVVVLAGLTACHTTRFVEVPVVHERWQHSTDTIIQLDSIIDQQQTIIREVDSATMAAYGIRLDAMQRAWLVESNRWKQQLSTLKQSKTDTIVQHDSIPVPYPVEVQVAKPLTTWQRIRIHMGEALLALLTIGGVAFVIRLRKH